METGIQQPQSGDQGPDGRSSLMLGKAFMQVQESLSIQVLTRFPHTPGFSAFSQPTIILPIWEYVLNSTGFFSIIITLWRDSYPNFPPLGSLRMLVSISFLSLTHQTCTTNLHTHTPTHRQPHASLQTVLLTCFQPICKMQFAAKQLISSCMVCFMFENIFCLTFQSVDFV